MHVPMILAGTAMRTSILGILVCAVLPSGFATAATKLTPAEIQSTFFNWAEFTAASPSGAKFTMTFTADGKARRVPAAKGGAPWRLRLAQAG
jgi:hypothetical protein